MYTKLTFENKCSFLIQQVVIDNSIDKGQKMEMIVVTKSQPCLWFVLLIFLSFTSCRSWISINIMIINCPDKSTNSEENKK